jgi:5-methylthioadenosine/S-adenosylhomocysteine deaminase
MQSVSGVNRHSAAINQAEGIFIMPMRNNAAKKLIEHVDILTMDKHDHIYKDGVILYSGDTIEYVGPRQGLSPEQYSPGRNDTEVLDGKGMLALPGFINAHCHVSMTIFRGYADNLPLWEWLSERIWPLEDKLEPADAYWLTQLGAAEMISAGVTTFSDMYMFMSETAQAVSDCGMRAVLGRGLTGPDQNTDQRHKDVEELYEWHRGNRDAQGRIRMLVAPHAVYTCSPDYLKTCRELAEKFGVGIHIHMSETAKEVADCVREYGKTPVRHLHDLGLFDLPVTAAHCVHLTGEDMELMQKKDVRTVHCPSSNMKLASGFAPVDELLSRGICVALGTDGAASNNNLSIFKEMSLAALIAKGYTGNAKALPAGTAVKMATIHGAEALGLQNETGSLEPGKKADIQLINTNQPHYHPKEDPAVHLVYSGYSGDVNTVIINGQTVMKDRSLTTIDLGKVCEEVDRIAARIL